MSAEATPSLRPGDTLRLALWFGLLAGLLELAVVAVRVVLTRRLWFLTPDTIWLAPLTDALIMLLPGAVFALLARTGAWSTPPRLVLGLYLFLALLGSLLVYNPLYGGAAFLLAAGLAIQGSRWLASRQEALVRLARRSVGVLLVLVVGSGIVLHVSRLVAERRSIAALVPARSGAPNVLLLVLDTVRALDLSLFGYQRRTTPELERWAAGGASFSQAISAAPWTLPSHASMFTGRWPHELAADWMVPLESQPLTLAEALTREGYLTAGFVANTKYCSRETGLARGFAHYEDYDLSWGQLAKGSSYGRALTGNLSLRRLLRYYDLPGRKTADQINAALLHWLGGAPGRPFFAFLNYYDAHDPYLPPEPFRSAFGPPAPRTMEAILADGKDSWTPAEVRGERDAYDGAIAYLDNRIGRLLEELKRRGMLENTIVVITADHGEEFAEHGMMRHGHSLYRPAVHVPLVVIYPGKVPAGLLVDTPVSLRDLPSTVVDLLGMESRMVFPGRSLAHVWRPEAGSDSVTTPILASVRFAERQKKSYPVSKGDMYSLLQKGLRYIRNGDGGEELYSFDEDPDEKENLAQSPIAGADLMTIRHSLETMLGFGAKHARPGVTQAPDSARAP